MGDGSTAGRGQVFARPVDDLWSSSASRDWCGASPRHRVIQPFAAEGARLDELDAGGAATASRRRFLPQLSGGPISAPGVVDAHLCARRGAMTSSSLTATCPSAPRIGMLCVAALHGADISRTAARKRQMRAPRGCFTPAVSTRHQHPIWLLTGFSHSPRFVRGRFHTAKNLSVTTLAQGTY